MIKKIIAETGADVDVEDDGSVNISGIDESSVEKAVNWVEGLVKEVQAGEIYEGTVVRMQPFGAFVEVLPGKDGLVHVSDMSEDFVKDPADIVKEGDTVTVRVKEIDNLGRINLSMILDPAKEKPREPRESGSGGRSFGGGRDRGGFRGGGDRGPRRDFGSGPRSPRRDDRGGQRSGGQDRRDRGNSGPHFPASRLVSTDKKRFGR